MFCLITLAFCFSRGVCSFPGLPAGGCRAVPAARSQPGRRMQGWERGGKGTRRGFQGVLLRQGSWLAVDCSREAVGEL